jgi:hypothetical protein
VDLDEFKMNVPVESVLHLVIFRKLQNEYFTKEFASEMFRCDEPKADCLNVDEFD